MAARIPFVNQIFECYSDFWNFWTRFCSVEKEKQVFTICDSKILKTEDQKMNEKLQYEKVKFSCKFGKPRPSTSKNIRQHSTFKLGCPAYLRLHVTKDMKLQIVGLDLNHQNHQLSQEYYDFIPENRKLASRDEQEIMEILKLKPNLKLVKKMIYEKYGKTVILKDLHNINSKLKDSDENNLSDVVDLLRSHYRADVALLHNKNKVFRALYFSTAKMRNDLRAWPEVIFLDGTYKLLNNDLITMILLVEDNNGRGQIAGVGLLASEEKEVMTWFLEKFKEENIKSLKEIKSFMTDKDLTERSVIKEIFPHVRTYICMFHTLKTFKKVVDSAKMNLSQNEKIIAKEYLEKLTKSNCPKQYESIYKDFVRSCPAQLVTYFDKNWHNITEEWVSCHMNEGNLSNKTNNRLESVNGKIKQVVKKNSTLKSMIISFFDWYNSHQVESTSNTSKQVLKQRVLQSSESSDEEKYVTKLTKYASDIILKELQEYKKIIIEEIHGEKEEFIIGSNPPLIVTSTSCTCSLWTSSRLPCRHIFSIRQHLKLCFYDESLYADRWAKKSMLENAMSDTKVAQPIIQRVSNTKILSESQRRKIVQARMEKLIHVISVSSGNEFQRRLDDIDELTEAYKQGHSVKIKVEKLEDSLRELSLHEKSSTDEDENSRYIESNTSILDINVPTPIKVKGRPRGYLRTTPSYSTKKKSEKFSAFKDIKKK